MYCKTVPVVLLLLVVTISTFTFNVCPAKAIGYSVTIWGWDYIEGWQIPVPITKDGALTGQSTPYTFTDLTGTHNFTVPSTNSAGHPFSDWSTDWTDETIEVSSAGTYTARYRAGYSVTIWGWCDSESYPWISVAITKDDASTGKTTPWTFTDLTGIHKFTVPSTDASGHVFYQWSTGWTAETLAVTSAGVYIASYREALQTSTYILFSLSPNPASVGQSVTLSGTLKTFFSEPLCPATVKIEYSLNGGASWDFFTDLNTNTAGQFSTILVAPLSPGSYLYRASYAGYANYSPSTTEETLDVLPAGTIYIRADGSIDPPTAPIVTTDQITYVLTSNIRDTIIVERSNLVFDGAGYTILGKGENAGIVLTGTFMVTVSNITIKDFSVGIFLASSVNNVLSGNNVKNTTCGIWVGPSSFGNALSGNNANNNTCGIALTSSSFNNVLSNNNVTANNEHGIFLNDSSHNTLSGNIVTPTPMGGILLNYSSENTLSGNNVGATGNMYGRGILLNYSSNNALSSNNVEGNSKGAGIWLSYSSSNVLSGNSLKGNDDGIVLDHSSLNTLSGNNVTEGIETGIYLRDSSNNNHLSGNNASANTGYGIYLSDSSNNNLLSGNNVTGNDDGVVLLSSSINSLSDNKITNNNEMGIYLMDSSSGNFLSGNEVANNQAGIRLDSSSYNFLFDNNLANNKCGIYLEGSSLDNTFYHNNFMANTKQVNTTYTQSANVWDNGYSSGGNYWSDHNPLDADKDKLGDSPYTMGENNADRYPLIYPFERYEAGYVCSPDLNKDGIVNIVDVTKVTIAFTGIPGDSNWNAIADIDLNEIINIVDVTMVTKDFGKK